jgi:peptidoglycan/xylan/chitin deacetylase (PgdA/CDA1 family)
MTWPEESAGDASLPVATAPFTARERLARKIFESALIRQPISSEPISLTRGTLTVSFDDFPRSAWREGGAVLHDYGVKATYYASGGLLGRRFNGIAQAEVADLEAIHAAGHEIGNHTFEHLAATRCTPERYRASIARNDRFLRSILPGLSLESFAYPHGLAPTWARLDTARMFTSSRATIHGVNGPTLDRSSLKAVGLEKWRLARMRSREVNFETLFEIASRERRWIIVYTHDVSDTPSPYGCTQMQLSRILDIARRHGLATATNAEVMRQHLLSLPVTQACSSRNAHPVSA